MPSEKRRPYLPLYTAAFRNDPAVILMGPLARGTYAVLLTGLWEQSTPGVVEDNDRILAYLAMVPEDLWLSIRDEVITAFDTTTEPGFLRQTRMIHEARAQERQRKRLSEAGKSGAAATNSRVKAATQGSKEVRKEEELPPVGPPPAPDGAATAKRARRGVPDRTIPPGFCGALAEQNRLPLETVEHLRDRLLDEFDARGYRSARSALREWCRREATNPRAAPNGNGYAEMPKSDSRKLFTHDELREPTPEERDRVSQLLKGQGLTK